MTGLSLGLNKIISPKKHKINSPKLQKSNLIFEKEEKKEKK
jgi:hypothetical protein